MTHCFSNESISNTDFITLIKAIDLAHCASQKFLPSAWKHIYYFPGGGSVDELDVFVVSVVSPKQEELQLFPLGVSNDCE